MAWVGLVATWATIGSLWIVATHTKKDSDARFLMVIATLIMAASAITFYSIAGYRRWDNNHEPGVCKTWGERMERQVQFIEVSYWDYGCYTLTNEGWINIDNLVKIEQGSGVPY